MASRRFSNLMTTYTNKPLPWLWCIIFHTPIDRRQCSLASGHSQVRWAGGLALFTRRPQEKTNTATPPTLPRCGRVGSGRVAPLPYLDFPSPGFVSVHALHDAFAWTLRFRSSVWYWYVQVQIDQPDPDKKSHAPVTGSGCWWWPSFYASAFRGQKNNIFCMLRFGLL